MDNISVKKILISVFATILSIGFVWLIVAGFISSQLKSGVKSSIKKVDLIDDSYQKKLVVKFYNEKTFYDSLAWLKKKPEFFPDCVVVAAVVPHHDIAGFMLSGLFSRLSRQEVETVIIVGPNHYERGGKILTSKASWETEFGDVYPDKKIIQSFVESGLVEFDDEALQEDHSISGLLPMLSYHMPNVKIVPIMLSAKNSTVEIDRLNKKLNVIMTDKKIVLVASSDFSHYLNQVDAEKKDQTTLEIIKSFDYEKLYGLGNDNLDSPASVATFLLAAQKRGDGRIHVVNHANSTDLLGANIVKTTSYYSLLSCRKED
jgi:AmmeMemoRadiSam system protein B